MSVGYVCARKGDIRDQLAEQLASISGAIRNDQNIERIQRT